MTERFSASKTAFFMLLLTGFVTFEYANAYDGAYDLTKLKHYSEPKIFDAGGNLSQRWYVYFSFRNPSTGKLQRQTPIYGGANHYHTKGERLEILTMYRRSLSDFLKKGFNPYKDNTARIVPIKEKGQSQNHQNTLVISILPLWNHLLKYWRSKRVWFLQALSKIIGVNLIILKIGLPFDFQKNQRLT